MISRQKRNVHEGTLSIDSRCNYQHFRCFPFQNIYSFSSTEFNHSTFATKENCILQDQTRVYHHQPLAKTPHSTSAHLIVLSTIRPNFITALHLQPLEIVLQSLPPCSLNLNLFDTRPLSLLPSLASLTSLSVLSTLALELISVSCVPLLSVPARALLILHALTFLLNRAPPRLRRLSVLLFDWRV